MVNRVLLLLLLLATTGCSGENEQLLDKLEQQMVPIRKMTSGYQVVRLDSLTDFKWDKVYFIADNSGGDTDDWISQTIGFKWSGRNIPTDSHRLLFVRGKEVVSYVDCTEWNRMDGSGTQIERLALPFFGFSCNGKSNYLTPEEARFAVIHYCVDGDVGYYWAPLSCLSEYRRVLAVSCQDLPAQLAHRDAVQQAYQDSIKPTAGHQPVPTP